MSISSIESLSTLVSTSVATYGGLQAAKGNSAQLINALVDPLGNANFTQAQAEAFAKRYALVDQLPNVPWNGFSAAVFLDKVTNRHVIAMRGTEIGIGGIDQIGQTVLDLCVTDIGKIGGAGFANNQAVEMYRYYKRLTTNGGLSVGYTEQEKWQLFAIKNTTAESWGPTEPSPALMSSQMNADYAAFKVDLAQDKGVPVPAGSSSYSILSPTEQVDVTGHSLGGHLAMLFARLFPNNVNETVTLNAPGFFSWGDAALTKMGFPAPNNARITRVEADGDAVSEIGTVWPGNTIRIAQESEKGAAASITGNHSSVNGNDALSLMSVMAKLDPRFANNAPGLSVFIRQASNTGANTYERVLDAIRAFLLGPNQTPTPISSGSSDPGRTGFYNNLYGLMDLDPVTGLPREGSVFAALQGKLQFVPSSANASTAASDFGQFLSLYYLSPFALKPVDAPSAEKLIAVQGQLGADWAHDKALSADDRAAGKAIYSDKYLADRAAMLSFKLYYDSKDKAYDQLYASVGQGGIDNPAVSAIFFDATKNITIDTSGTGNEANDRLFYFGKADVDDTMGGANSDRIYGMAGDDLLKGEGGNDWLEGGAGDDQLRGCTGADVLVGGADNDTAYGEDGNDSLYGGVGNDNLFGGANDDLLQGWTGVDYMEGGSGKDQLRGGDDTDFLFGDSENDALYGDGGDDNLTGGTGNDWLEGGDGEDIYAFNDGDGSDVITDSDGRGRISINGNVLPVGIGFAGDNAWLSADGKIRFQFAPDSVGSTKGTLTITYTGGKVTVKAYEKGSMGVSVQDNPAPNSVAGEGTALSDNLFTSNPISAGDDNDFIIATGSNSNTIDGGDGNDFISIGMGSRRTKGGAGNDAIVSNWYVRPDVINNTEWEQRYASWSWSVSAFGALHNPLDQNISDDTIGRYLQISPETISVNGVQRDAWKGYTEYANPDSQWIDAEAGNDIAGGGQGDDTIFGGLGADTLSGNEGNDLIAGGADDDEITGNWGQDSLQGQEGNDSIYGGSEADLLIGGDGNDMLQGDDNFTGIDFSRHGDDLMEGGNGNDVLYGMGANDTLIGSDGNDTLYGSGAADMPANFDGKDYLDGGAGNDLLNGGEDNDTLFGGSGDDTLSGDSGGNVLAGADYLDGGIGNDLLVGGNGADSLWGGDGDDTIATDGDDVPVVLQGDDLAHGDLGNDYIRGYGGNDQLYGDAGNDTIFGETGSDAIDGGADIDWIDGGDGNDTIFGGDGNDGIAGTTVRLGSNSGALRGGAGNDLINGGSGSDGLMGEDGNDTLVGGADADQLEGGDGDDSLDGGGGDDLMVGGAGRDTYVYSDGADSIIDTAGFDTLILSGISKGSVDIQQDGTNLKLVTGNGTGIVIQNGFAGAIDRFNFGTGAVYLEDLLSGNDNLTPQANNIMTFQTLDATTGEGEPLPAPDPDDLDLRQFLRLGLNSFNLTGTAGIDSLYGSGVNDIINGLDGDDLIYAANGNDLIDAGNGANLVDGEGGNDSLTGGSDKDTLLGGEGNDQLTAKDADDLLIGGAGNDTLIGGNGSDRYEFASGFGIDVVNDQATTANTKNIISFTDPVDREALVLTRDAVDVVIKFTNGDQVTIKNYFVNPNTTNFDINFADGVVWGVEDIKQRAILTATEGNDSLFGSEKAELIDGLGGKDSISGFGGNDSLYGGAGNDILDGGSGNDLILGGNDWDTLYGGDGDDTLDGGSGAPDYLYGGAGNDTYLIQAGATITLNYQDKNVSDSGTNVVRFASGISPAQIALSRPDMYTINHESNALILSGMVNGVFTSVSIEDYFIGGDPAIKSIRFDDYPDTVWTYTDIAQRLMTPTAADDNIVLQDIDDQINGLAGNDLIYGVSGNDKIDGGEGDDELFGGIGADLLSGGNGNDRLNGEAGDDFLLGGAGNDYLEGGTGSDVFDSGAGNDTMSGGDSAVFIFGRGYGNDLILGTHNNQHAVYFDQTISPNDVLATRNNKELVLSVKNSTDQLTLQSWFNSKNYLLDNFVFADGTVWHAADVTAQLKFSGSTGNDTIYGMEYSDTLDGLAGNDYLDSGAGNDILYGRDGNDALEAGNGNDTLEGGAGDDQLNGRAGSDTYVFGKQFGHDIIYAENRSLSDYANWNDLDTLKFDFLPSEITVTRGGSYNSNLILTVSASGDQITVYDWFNQNLRNTLQAVFSDGTRWDASELVTRSAMAPTALNDYVYGSPGNDSLTGLAGNDGIRGGEGNDTLIGGTGNDNLDGGSGADTYKFELGSGNDTIYGRDVPASSAIDTIEYASEILPTDISRTVQGTNLLLKHATSGDSITLYDWLSDDRSRVRWVKFANGTIWDLVMPNSGAINGTTGSDSYAGTPYNDTISGLGGNDSIRGEAGDDLLIGGDGSDSLDGGYNGGLDTLDGGAGNDVMWIASRDSNSGDVVVFGHGYGADTLYLSTSSTNGTIQFKEDISPEQITLRSAVDKSLIIGLTNSTDQLRIYNWFNRSEPDRTVNKFVFSNGQEWDLETIRSKISLIGGNQSDVIYDFTGDDVLDGGAGNDTLDAWTGNDSLMGGAGNDSLLGRTGNDTLCGNSGNDTLDGGDGNDIYLFSLGDGQDVIGESNSPYTQLVNTDSIILGSGITPDMVTIAAANQNDLELAILGTSDRLTISGGLAGGDSRTIEKIIFNDGTIWDVPYVRSKVLNTGLRGGYLFGSELSDSIRGAGSADTLDGFGGNDVLSGMDGSDVLYGGFGDDTLDGGIGADSLNGGFGSDTYQFGIGSGRDLITDVDMTPGTVDRVKFGPGIRPEDVQIGNGPTTISLSLKNTNDVLDISWFGPGGYPIEEFVFENGVVWTAEYVHAIASNLVGTEGADLISGSDIGQSIMAGAGNDTVYGAAGNDNISGQGGDDLLFGEADNDVVNGGDGNDTLDGGAGINTLIGGAGNDTYVITNAGDVITENANEGTDLVNVSATFSLATFANVENLTLMGSNAIDATGNALANTLTGNSADNVLDGGAGVDTLLGGGGNDTYVIDDSGDVITENANEGTDLVKASATFSLTNFANVENLTLTGTSAINATGNALANTLIGNSGDNRLDGGAGNDTMIGGAGNDTYVINVSTDVVTENANEGIDTIETGITLSIASLANIENIALTGSNAINATGNTSTNLLTGNGGNNTLDGGVGADTLIGGAGNDTYVVDNAGDVITENANEGTDLVNASVTFSLANFANVENLTLTGTSAINATGNALANTLTGNSGNNVLDGGAGNDTLVGGAGNDTYVVDSLSDVVTEAASAGTDTIQTNLTYTIASLTNVENLTLTGTGAINATGNALANVLTGNSGNNRIDGGTGNDTMIGGVGNDTYVFDVATDVATENANEGTDTIETGVTLSIASLANIENITLTGSGTVNATGNAAANVLTGNSGANTLDGGAGIDTLIGGAGNDTYVVDNAGDVITENANEGTDLVNASVTFSLATFANVENLTLTGTSAINATGNALANTLTGNSGSNVLDGGAGNDTLVGGAGNDTYVVDSLSDVVTEASSAGTDTIQTNLTYTLASLTNVENLTLTGSSAVNATGNTLANVLRGNSGNNRLDGGSGNDTMIGGAGNDTYVFNVATDVATENANEGIDTIEIGVTLSIASVANVENITLTGTSTINATGNALDNVLLGNSGNNTLTGGAGNDRLDGGAGNDTMVGGTGNDTYVVNVSSDVVTENANEGTDTVESSITYTIASLANLENITLLGSSAINATGNASANALIGNSGVNVLTGGAGNDTLDGAAGNDSLVGGTGNDTYVLGRGYGAETVTENDTTAGNTDVASFMAGITNDQIWFRKVNTNDLEVSVIGTSDKLTLTSWYLGNQYHVEQFKTADGKLLLDTDVQKLVDAMAAFAPPAAGQTTLPSNYQATLSPVLAANWH